MYSHVLTEIRIPTVDISAETERHVIVAQGTATDWQGHTHTVLLPDGKTMYCVWQGQEGLAARTEVTGPQTQFHGKSGPRIKRSTDGGLTWSDRIAPPSNWTEIGRGAPTIHRLVDARGRARLFVFCRDQERTTFLRAVSEDDGQSWSPMQPLPLAASDAEPITGWTAPISILEATGPNGAKKHLMWYEHGHDGKPTPGVIWQSASYDGGLTWGESKPVVDKAGASEPAVVRSPDGKQLLLLIREESRKLNSLFSVSDDEGLTWSEAQPLPLALTGDRFMPRYALDGRLVIVFRPFPPVALEPAGWRSKRSYFTAWVGRYEDVVKGREGQYRIKLVRSHAGTDHSYPGLELLPDDSFVATTYIKYRPGPELHSVVSVRFNLAELDAQVTTTREARGTMGETLYNGITLPRQWPPREMDPQSDAPMPVPWLEYPPETIPINVGRQLFVDDFLVQENTLKRIFHKPERYAGNPVLEAETIHELAVKPRVGLQQGGVFYNPAQKRFEMFYHSGTLDPRRRHMAVSQDMVHWERPDFGSGWGNAFREPSASGESLSPGTPGAVFAVWLDLDAREPNARYKFLGFERGRPGTHTLHTSPDGIHWSSPALAGPADDAQSLFFNPFRQVWVYSIKRNIRRGGKQLRARFYAEHRDFLKGGDWRDAVYWTCADRLDLPEPAGSYPAHPVQGDSCQLYALHGVAYESIMLGMHEIHRGPENPVCTKGRFPKLTDLELGYSRDGFHWHRPDRSGFIRCSRREGDWDRAYLHSTTSILVIHQDRLIFPYSGYSGTDPDGSNPNIYGGGTIGMAVLRRDGFASMRADAHEQTLLTRPLTFDGEHLFVNVDNPGGFLATEVCDGDGTPLPGFTKADCVPIRADSTRMRVHWRQGQSLAGSTGRSVRFRFYLRQGDLYAFWVSRSQDGASGGYVAGGGPEFSGNRDL